MAAALAAPGGAQRQFDELSKRGLPVDTDGSRATVLGDVDGDGDLDLVVGNLFEQSRLYLNNGTGTFTDATTTGLPAATAATTSLAMGDVDGDGDLDLIVGNELQQSLLYVNNGAGTFTDATAGRLPVASDATRALALGDVDGDGDLDLIAGNHQQQSRLYLNDGTGMFTDATATRMPAAIEWTTSLALGDVDGDGDADLIMGNGSSFRTLDRLYLNDGAGTFTDATTSRLPAFLTYTTALALGDLDADGDLDLVVGTSRLQNRVLLNDGAGTFATVSLLDADTTTSLALGDVDVDGDLDLVVGNTSSQNRVYLNDGTSSFVDATTRLPVDMELTNAVALGDVDADGDLDLVFGNGGRQNRLHLNDGAGTFIDATAPRVPLTPGVTALALGDVDGDFDLDLVVGSWEQCLLYVNNSTGTFTDVTASRMPVFAFSVSALALADLDADGDLDLIVGNGGSAVRVLQNDGTGTFTNAFGLSGESTVAVVAGDMDGDGDTDVVVGNFNRRSRLYLNNGTGAFTDVTTTHMPAGTFPLRELVSGDVDGDGDPDLVLGNGDNNGTPERLYLNNGMGMFTDATAGRMPAVSDYTWSVALADVDGDGDLDLVAGNGIPGGQQNRLYLNDGTGVFSDATASRLPLSADYTLDVAFGDVDGDTDLDLIVGNIGTDSLYLNDGTGTFTYASAVRMPVVNDWTTRLAVGDLDGDGDLDVVVGNATDSRLYVNLLRQLDAPLVLHVGRPYPLDVYARYGPPSSSDTAFPFMAAGPARIPFPPLGTIGVDLSQTIALGSLAVAQPMGIGTLTLSIPNLPALAGASIYVQAVLVQQPMQASLTNVTVDVVLR